MYAGNNKFKKGDEFEGRNERVWQGLEGGKRIKQKEWKKQTTTMTAKNLTSKLGGGYWYRNT